MNGQNPTNGHGNKDNVTESLRDEHCALNRRSYVKLTGLSLGGLSVASGTVTATASDDGYGIGGYGVGPYGNPEVDDSLSVSTGSPSDVGESRATFHGTLPDLGGASTADVYFEYGLAGESLSSATSAQTLSSTGTFSETVDGLTAGTEYAYRTVAKSSSGAMDTGTTVTFTASDSGTDLTSSTTLQPNDSILVDASTDTNHVGYTGDGFVNFQAEGSVEWTINADAPAEYEVTIRYALDDEARTGTLSAGGETQDVTVESTGGWSSWETLSKTVTIPEGTSVVRIQSIGEDFGNVDAVTFEETTTKTQTTTLQASDGDLVDCTLDVNHAGYTGDGFVNFPDEGHVEWTVESDTAAECDLTIRYALGARRRTGALTVAGETQDVTAESTGGWGTWETVTRTVMIPEGTSTVRLASIGEDFGNVDAVTLEETNTTTQTTTLQAGDGDLVGCTLDANHAGYAGDGFVNFPDEGHVEWTIDAARQREYELLIRYALGDAARTGTLSAGGETQEVTVESTGGWGSWETLSKTVTIPEGTSVVRIQSTGEDFGNVDLVELVER